MLRGDRGRELRLERVPLRLGGADLDSVDSRRAKACDVLAIEQHEASRRIPEGGVGEPLPSRLEHARVRGSGSQIEAGVGQRLEVGVAPALRAGACGHPAAVNSASAASRAGAKRVGPGSSRPVVNGMRRAHAVAPAWIQS